jgi:hypothetical protein
MDYDYAMDLIRRNWGEVSTDTIFEVAAIKKLLSEGYLVYEFELAEPAERDPSSYGPSVKITRRTIIRWDETAPHLINREETEPSHKPRF